MWFKNRPKEAGEEPATVNVEPLPETIPGVDRAYDFVLPSYAWALDRLKAVDSRLQEVMVYSASLTFGAPVLIASVVRNADYEAPAFIAALAIFVVIIAAGLFVRARGAAFLPSPGLFYKSWLEFSDKEFKRKAVYFAGKHMAENQRLVNLKGHAASAMTVLLGVEVALLLYWAVDQL